jgi:hypothetical protein
VAFDPDIQGQIDASTKAVNAALAAAQRGSKLGLQAFAEDFVSSMYDKLNQEGSGVQYPGLPNQSSAPGEPPAPQSEAYRDSWDYVMGEDKQGPYVDVGSPDEKGPLLEMGTSEMDPRPHLRPLVDEKKGELTIRIAQQSSGGQEEAFGKTQGIVEQLLGGGE